MITPEGYSSDSNPTEPTETFPAPQVEDILENNAVETVEDPDQKAIRLGQDRGVVVGAEVVFIDTNMGASKRVVKEIRPSGLVVFEEGSSAYIDHLTSTSNSQEDRKQENEDEYAKAIRESRERGIGIGVSVVSRDTERTGPITGRVIEIDNNGIATLSSGMRVNVSLLDSRDK